MKKWTILLFLLPSTLLFGQSQKLIDFVDPFIGTGSHGHTYPGAILPFGGVQLSPDTRNDNSWDNSGGYHYDDPTILGFTHTHLSGVGVPDYCDILFQPFTGKTKLDPGTEDKPETGYRSRFNHKEEEAKPGYYGVKLLDYDIDVALSVTKRVGIHKYNYPKKVKQQKILIDLQHKDEVVDAFIRVVSPTEIQGYRISKDWANEQHVYFVAQFSSPIVSAQLFDHKKEQQTESLNGEAIQAVLNFEKSREVLVKVGISAVDIEGARKNLNEELPHWDFDQVVSNAASAWETEMQKIKVEGGSLAQKRNFYTSWYHCLVVPNVYNDVDGRYRGMDKSIHTVTDGNQYTIFSLWDTFRGLHPLLATTHTEETKDFVNTLVRMYEQFGVLPMWELSANDTYCMIAYHAVSVFADAQAKGIKGMDLNKMLEASLTTANQDKRGLFSYKTLGYVGSNASSQSVSKTLEYAYNDWCIAQLAKAANDTKNEEIFTQRAQFYQNVYDPSRGFMVGRNTDRAFAENFEATKVGYDFTEGNSFQYSLFVPHDMQGMRSLLGGSEALESWLDSLFIADIDPDLDDGTDVTGLIGNYAHGNEPSHHMAYLYNYTSAPWKTQERVYQILNDQYKDHPAGISGNEDCGQMSAWYVLSAMGFYSVNPGQPEFQIGVPLFDQVSLSLPNNATFNVAVDRESSKSKYIHSMKMNGVPYHKSFIDHKDIIEGGKWEVVLKDLPPKNNPFTVEATPYVVKRYASVPYVIQGDNYFLNTTDVSLASEDDSEIYYTLDGTTPTKESIKYTQPFIVDKKTEVKFRAYHPQLLPSYVVTSVFQPSSSPSKISENTLSSGLTLSYYEGVYRSVYDFENDQPKFTKIVNQVNLDHIEREEWIGMSFDGYIYIDEEGNYTFEVDANDGSQMLINGIELFESDGRKTKSLPQSQSMLLMKGYHQVSIKYFQCSDKKKLVFSWQKEDGEKELVPDAILFSNAATQGK
ncbi:GH92 family glycosyl hydrolase [Flammeovirga pacifica]|uniref:PA14 domain-containing protein n=1 Tax=Flammeovirga pacifica TaxID=915059 RepID=A0A1S1YS21_FLAPC|nr:GH92 family glycosyl hydrolase [Flammeovirga pacifica]OHX63828.1 hypothetical protein NH26_19645 [Flammeovirga pacifica]